MQAVPAEKHSGVNGRLSGHVLVLAQSLDYIQMSMTGVVTTL